MKLTINFMFFLLAVSSQLFVSGCDSADNPPQDEIIIFAAASTTDAISDIAAEFSKVNNVKVIKNFAASSALAQQIENGADADIFISANLKWAEYLQQKQLSDQINNIVSNRLVIVIPKSMDIKSNSTDILLDPKITNIAMGDPSAVPAGKYGKEALTRLGLWDTIVNKVVAAKDVRSALAYAETQAAEAAIVYSTDAAISDKVKVAYIFPDDATEQPITYPAMILKKSRNNDNAIHFFEFLKSQQAKDIFNHYGFITE